MTDNEDRLISLKELAEYLHLNQMTVYGWAQKGKIPAFKVGRNWRFKKDEIDLWLKKTQRNR